MASMDISENEGSDSGGGNSLKCDFMHLDRQPGRLPYEDAKAFANKSHELHTNIAKRADIQKSSKEDWINYVQYLKTVGERLKNPEELKNVCATVEEKCRLRAWGDDILEHWQIVKPFEFGDDWYLQSLEKLYRVPLYELKNLRGLLKKEDGDVFNRAEQNFFEDAVVCLAAIYYKEKQIQSSVIESVNAKRAFLMASEGRPEKVDDS